MLVLSRGKGDKIYIGKGREVVLTILDIHNGKVRVGVEADLPVYRAEAWDQTNKKEGEDTK